MYITLFANVDQEKKTMLPLDDKNEFEDFFLKKLNKILQKNKMK